MRLWSAIGMVAGALERRVWINPGPGPVYPNLYTLLVAPPGVGKYVVNTVRELMFDVLAPGTKTKAFKVAPDNMTKAALLDRLAKSKQTLLPPRGAPVEFHAMMIAAEEFGVLLPAWDNEFIAALNSIYNNPTVPYSEERRHGPARELSIPFPNLNILGGVQPVWLGMTLPEEAWGMGLMTRMIMIYSAEGITRSLAYTVPMEPQLREKIISSLGALSQLYGAFQWGAGAFEFLDEWHIHNGPPTPTHTKLGHYNRRRTLHIIKLSMIASVAASTALVIELIHVKRAINWLLDAEKLMPDIFRDMIGKSDTQIIEELHYFVTANWAKEKGKPVHPSVLINFLRQKVPSDKIDKIIAVAEASNIIARVAGGVGYLPRPKHEHGVE